MSVALELALELPARGSRQLQRELHNQLRSAILDGRLASGVQLPASRALAKSLDISRTTIVGIYDLLLGEGYVVSRPGAGVFVAEGIARKKVPDRRDKDDIHKGHINTLWRDAVVLPAKLTRDIEFDFRLGTPDTAEFPFDVWRRLSDRALRDFSRRPRGYQETAGDSALRAAIAGHVSFARAVACGPQDIVVTRGAQQAFDLLARVLVTKEKTVVAVEDPGYPPVRAAFAAAGASVISTPVDADGLIVDRLPADVSIICVTPSHQFPLGVPMSAGRRATLLTFAAERNAVIIEDDYDGEFRFHGRPLDALQTLDRNNQVFYVGTFSKSLFPALRLGFVVTPPWAHSALVAASQISNWYGPTIDQDILAAFISEGHLVRHVKRMRKIYAKRRVTLLHALQNCSAHLAPFPAVAGLHLAASVRSDVDVDAIVKQAMNAGIAVQNLGMYSFQHPVPGLVFSYGTLDDARIEEAVSRIRRILAELL